MMHQGRLPHASWSGHHRQDGRAGTAFAVGPHELAELLGPAPQNGGGRKRRAATALAALEHLQRLNEARTPVAIRVKKSHRQVGQVARGGRRQATWMWEVVAALGSKRPPRGHGTVNRKVTRERLIQHAANRIPVGRRSQRRTLDLFRSHERQGPGHVSADAERTVGNVVGGGKPWYVGTPGSPSFTFERKPKIADDHATIASVDKHVGRLQVPMQPPRTVQNR